MLGGSRAANLSGMDVQIFCVAVWSDFLFIKLDLNACDFPVGLSLKDVSISNRQLVI